MVKIGFAKVDITPKMPVWLCGQFYERKATDVETPVFANAMAVEGDNTQFIFCSCDLAFTQASLIDAVKEKVLKINSEINTESIILFATHTHTSVDCLEEGVGLSVAKKFLPENIRIEDTSDDTVLSKKEALAYLSDKISEVICVAWEKRKPARFAHAYRNAVIGHCRRVSYDDGTSKMYGEMATPNMLSFEGTMSTDVELFYVFDKDNKPMGVIVNVPCPSQVVEMKSFVSSDYWGKVRPVLEEKYGNDFCVLGMCSAAGDQAPRDLTRIKQGDYKRMQEVEGTIELGKRISSVVIDAMEEAKEKSKDDAKISHIVKNIDLPLRRVTETECKNALKEIDEYIKNAGDKEYTWRDLQSLFPASGIINRYQEQRKKHIYPITVHAVRFDDTAFVTNPFELFLDYGIRIKVQSPAQKTFIAQLSSGSGGYLPTEKAERGGHYSAVVASGNVGHEGGDILVLESLTLLNKLWEED